tara:strand:+ start:119 stop:562 length:444 start_codon:yes stop_codon:yes gene_type:complete
MPIKSFKGQIADGGIDTIPLHTNDGSTGYRIKKLEVFPAGSTGTFEYESFLLVNSIEPTTASSTPDFSDQTLLAGIYFTMSPSGAVYPEDVTMIIDNMIFNQDIYISHNNNAGNVGINYYMELEQMPLALDENTVATLKDIRNIEAQ